MNLETTIVVLFLVAIFIVAIFFMFRQVRKQAASKAPVQITKDMLIGAILKFDPEIAKILMKSGMHCVGCPSSSGESLEEACRVHNMNCDQVLKDINEYLAKKN